ncbi:MAG: ATP-grasp domain-containing protein [Holophagales bacterium]|jgi:acetyl-CoA carboxylase biotin carboxylase subunit|nr:ATP-grasp domain-containing protein [Holophagales bacterium]
MAITKILVANRAEIASRIIRTCRVREIPTVAVFSDVDRGAMHVRLAEESLPLCKTNAMSEYADLEQIIATAKTVCADALHPGYGFLSDDPDAARRVIEAGLVWIGPGPETLETMGDKVKARRVAESVGVPVLPAVTGQMDDDALFAETKKLGFPLMIKAVKGENGKAMRLVRSVNELRRSLPWVKGDGIFLFDDEQVYLEKALLGAHQIEVQIMADKHGNMVYLWERDGSIQRRYQQILEEAPSPFVTPTLRKTLGEAAMAIAKKIGYVGTGSVEFLIDSDYNFYFLEMTCRLQGGHPATEWITGQDIVKWQIDIAAGEKLPLKQSEIPLLGHAILARINAEDPMRNFAPSSGRINYLRVPAGRNVRNDSGVYSGWVLPPAYAPMLSKLSTWGLSRDEAIRRMAPALAEYRVGGVRNNIAFHQALNSNEAFRRGETNTAMLEQHWWTEPEIGPDLKFVVAAALYDELEMEETRAQQLPTRLGEARPSQWKYWDKFNRL